MSSAPDPADAGSPVRPPPASSALARAASSALARAGSSPLARPGGLAALAGLLAAGLFLALPTEWPSYDAVAYALDVESTLLTGSPARLLHPYHVLLGPLGWLVARALGPWGVHPLLALQLLNAVAGGALVALVVRLVHRETGRPLAALGAAALVAGWGTVAYHATNGEPYVPAAAALAGALAALPCRAGTAGPWRWLLLAGLLAGLAAGLHASLVVAGPVLALAAATGPSWPPGGLGRVAARVAAFAAAAAIATAPAYLARWLHARPIGLEGALRDTVGSFLGPQNPVTPRYFLAEPYDVGVELAALVRSVAWPWADAPRGAAAAALLAVPILLLAGLAASLPACWRARDRRALAAAASFVVLLLFFTSYNLGSPKFTVFLAVTLVLGAALGAARALPSPRAAGAAAAALLAAGVATLATNAATGLVPATSPAGNERLEEALALRDALAPDDAVLLVGRGEHAELKVLVPYFAQREVVVLDFLFGHGVLPPAESYRRARSRVERVRARGGRVVTLAAYVADHADLRAFRERNDLPEDAPWTALGFRPGPLVRDALGRVAGVELQPAPPPAPPPVPPPAPPSSGT